MQSMVQNGTKHFTVIKRSRSSTYLKPSGLCYLMWCGRSKMHAVCVPGFQLSCCHALSFFFFKLAIILPYAMPRKSVSIKLSVSPKSGKYFGWDFPHDSWRWWSSRPLHLGLFRAGLAYVPCTPHPPSRLQKCWYCVCPGMKKLKFNRSALLVSVSTGAQVNLCL